MDKQSKTNGDMYQVDELIRAAIKAGTKCKPIPFVVEADMISINGEPIMTERHVVEEGRLGDAWATVPANSSVGRALIDLGFAKIYSSDPDIVIYTIDLFGNSHAKVKAYVEEFARVLIEAGVGAVAYDTGD